MTTAESIYTYTIEDVSNIINNGFEYTLPDETIKLIESLSEKVGAPSYIKTPNFNKKYYKRNKGKSEQISDDDWKSIRDFKKTEIKEKVGNEIYIDKLRRYLNKITDENYNEERDNIIKLIEEVKELEDDEILYSAGNIIFVIASQNKFYSKLYAKLYSELKEKFSIIDEIFNKSYTEFIKTFEIIEYVDAEEDYDKFCLVNKENDNRKAMSLFITHLINFEMATIDSGIELLNQLKEKFQYNIEKENCNKLVEEICENLFIIITNGYDKMDNNDKWDNIIDYINLISNKEASDYPSLSNKVIFKCMDIIEEIN